jgi:serine protease Do
MEKRRVILSCLVVLTLAIGVGIGTVVQDRVAATVQTPAAQLTIPDPVQLSGVFRQVAEQVGPAVVHINTQSTVRGGDLDPFGGLEDFFPFFEAPDVPQEDRQARGQGSGFIVDPSGYIITNNHVVDNADQITVILQDESEYEAVVIGVDTETDLAVIKIEDDEDFPTARLGNSDSMFVGDWVLALGSPFGFDNTLTAGIVSAVGRDGTTSFQRFIQTDAAINPGNSGGPLVNLAGEVVGINTAIVTSTASFAGIGFALPSNTAVDVYNQLTTEGRVTRGFIGIQFEANEDLVQAFGLDSGVVVRMVTPDGPSSLAGMRSGDVITRIDGEPVSNSDDLLEIVASRPVGSSVPIVVVRGGAELTLNVTIADRQESLAENGGRPNLPGNRDEEVAPARLGIGVQSISRQFRSVPGGRDLQGVMVSSVEPGSAPDEAGIRPGMVISEIVESGTFYPITDVEDFRRVERELVLESGSVIAFQLHFVGQTGQEIQSTFLPVRIP